MIALHNGQVAPVTGWFIDTHGHRIFLRHGQMAPICPWGMTTMGLWRLVREIAERRRN